MKNIIKIELELTPEENDTLFGFAFGIISNEAIENNNAAKTLANKLYKTTSDYVELEKIKSIRYTITDFKEIKSQMSEIQEKLFNIQSNKEENIKTKEDTKHLEIFLTLSIEDRSKYANEETIKMVKDKNGYSIGAFLFISDEDLDEDYLKKYFDKTKIANLSYIIKHCKTDFYVSEAKRFLKKLAEYLFKN